MEDEEMIPEVVYMETKEIMPGLKLRVTKNFEKKYLDLETMFINGADIIEDAAKTDIKNAGANHRFLQNYLKGANSKEINEQKYIIEVRIKKLQTIPDMIKELIKWDKKNLQIIEEAMKKLEGEEV